MRVGQKERERACACEVATWKRRHATCGKQMTRAVKRLYDFRRYSSGVVRLRDERTLRKEGRGQTLCNKDLALRVAPVSSIKRGIEASLQSDRRRTTMGGSIGEVKRIEQDTGCALKPRPLEKPPRCYPLSHSRFLSSSPLCFSLFLFLSRRLAFSRSIPAFPLLLFCVPLLLGLSVSLFPSLSGGASVIDFRFILGSSFALLASKHRTDEAG